MAAGALFFSLGLVLLAGCGQDATVATVNGEAISSKELKQQLRVFQSVRPGSPDDEGTRRVVLDQLVKQRLLVQAAKKAGLDKDPKLQAQIESRRKSLRAELEKNIADAQAQLLSLDQAVEARSLIEAYSQAERGRLTVTAKDLQAAYAKVKARGQSLPAFQQMRDQLLEQVILDRLVDEARVKAVIDIPPGAAK